MYLAALFCALFQTDTLPKPSQVEVFTIIASQNPWFKPGIDSLNLFFRQHSQYPREAIEQSKQGTVAIRFIVKSDGSVSNPEITGTNPGYGMDKEALRLAGIMPDWRPALAGGRAVHAYIKLFFRFDLLKGTVVADEVPQGSIFRYTEQPAHFPGGETALQQFITDNLRYPAQAKDNGISGTVRVAFIFSSRKVMTNIHTTGSELGGGLEAEALRIVHAMPPWKGSITGGRNLPSYDTVNIRFILPEVTL